MKTLPRRSQLARYLFHLALVFSYLILAAASSWAIVVTNTNDSGAGSLRRAIVDANADGVATTITFDAAVFPAAAPVTIFVLSQLPALTGPADTIDGTGSGVILDGGCSPLLADGTVVCPFPAGVGIRVRASNITIRGLTIQNFPDDGITVQPGPGASNVTITGVVITQNFITNNFDGLRVSGQTGPGNQVGATISGNILIRNRDDGIFVQASSINPVGDTSQNTVDVVIDNNVVRGSEGVRTGGTISGDGIRVNGGGGSDNILTATISNNNTWENIDDGILVAGGGPHLADGNNMVDVEILNNHVRGRGLNTPAFQGNGIRIRGGNRVDSGVISTSNQITFLIANNKVLRMKDRGINVSGGLGSLHTVSGSVTGNGINSIEGPSGTGILIRSGDCVADCSNNTVEDIVVEDNTVSGSLTDGIRIDLGSGSGHTVSVSGVIGNVTNKNGRDGLSIRVGVPGTGTTPISENRADKNGEDGIDVDAIGYILSNNSADKNGVDGINAVGNIDGGGNTATGNASCNTPGCI